MTSSSDQPRRRFAPVPIETTFQSVRNSPEPCSHRSASPANPDPRLRFHPQLIETSRRTHRAGDVCPATRPADKTDITPYTNHIYLAKPKPRRRCHHHHHHHHNHQHHHHMPPSRRETEDDDVKEYLLQITAREAARQMEDAALAAFPNSRPREGDVAHFYFGESSGSDKSQQQEPRRRLRRKSSDLGLNWWHRHMQEHAQLLAQSRDVVTTPQHQQTFVTTDSELDNMDLSLPPDPLWTTSGRDAAVVEKPCDPVPTPPVNGDDPASLAALYGGRSPFCPMGIKPEKKIGLLLTRQEASPPMLGKDLTFRRCPSPKPTKLETDRPFASSLSRDKGRDAPGLWRGYCCRSSDKNGTLSSHPPGSSRTNKEVVNGLWTCRNGFVDNDDRQRRGKTKATGAEIDDKIMREFDDTFVTQVYNYLSLGHPATARPFDEELARISRVGLDELASRDHHQHQYHHHHHHHHQQTQQQRQTDQHQHHRRHEAPEKASSPDLSRCPRWRALKLYIVEWARQHPDLDSLDPLAWGVGGDRRGSWAI
ncbi:hypothetical protein CP532_2210 [Ophiocordyceps camponoti-leonardi (nom. inval.)]|nr:hypothetical protein CP532_2210 [Ophiocordyceps camponoti-leonardi (nom. inval.)]